MMGGIQPDYETGCKFRSATLRAILLATFSDPSPAVALAFDLLSRVTIS